MPLPPPPTTPPTPWKLPAIPPSPSIPLKHLWQLMFKSGVGLSVPCYNGKDQASDSPPVCHMCTLTHVCTYLLTYTHTNTEQHIGEMKKVRQRERKKTDLSMLKENKQSVRKAPKHPRWSYSSFRLYHKISIIINFSCGCTAGQATSTVFLFVKWKT